MTQTSNPIIRIESVSKTFPGNVQALDNVSLEVRQGEFFAMLGPSGCGKTTLLRMLAGFETPTRGCILIEGQDMEAVPPNRRPVNMVFQSYAVFPHMTVAQNVGYGLKIEKTPRKEIRQRVEEALSLVRLEGLGRRMPDELSGGQRQRVALARALIKRPSVLLLDEPLSALDAKLRENMQLELVRLQKTVGITFVIVTHDQSEALSMADRIAVMENGRVQQIARPAELYEAPNCRFVASFIGQINLFDGIASVIAPDRIQVETASIGTVVLPGTTQGPVSLAIRPEKITLSATRPPEADRPDTGMIVAGGCVTEIAYFGGYSNVFVDAGAEAPVMAEVTNTTRNQSPDYTRNDRVWLSFQAEDTVLLSR